MLLTSRFRRMSARRAEKTSHEAGKNTAETEESNNENLRESADDNKSMEVEDWIEKENKIDRYDHDPHNNKQEILIDTHCRLPTHTHTQWRPNFKIVYHQFP